MEKSIIFYNLTKNKKEAVTPEFENFMANPEKWPDEWKNIYYKTYPRLPQVDLNSYIEKSNFDLFQSLEKRVSSRNNAFNPKTPVTLKEIANLLYWSGGIKKGDWNKSFLKRFYPSGGARYPLEIYFYLSNANLEFQSGLYHYNVKDNAAELLLNEQLGRPKMQKVFLQGLTDWAISRANLAVFITAVFWRNQIKYGERGFNLIHIEAGHLAQNFSLVSQALGLKSCNLAGFYSDEIHNMLDIDGIHEAVITSLVFGK